MWHTFMIKNVFIIHYSKLGSFAANLSVNATRVPRAAVPIREVSKLIRSFLRTFDNAVNLSMGSSSNPKTWQGPHHQAQTPQQNGPPNRQLQVRRPPRDNPTLPADSPSPRCTWAPISLAKGASPRSTPVQQTRTLSATLAPPHLLRLAPPCLISPLIATSLTSS